MPIQYKRRQPNRRPTLCRKVRVGLKSLLKKADPRDEWEVAAAEWIERMWRFHEKPKP